MPLSLKAWTMALLTCRSHSAVVSYIDTSLASFQKYVSIVDDKPFYMMSVQVRLDKLAYFSGWGWNFDQMDALFEQLASDGFNTVGVPVHWYFVEPQQDAFNWTILEAYLGMVSKHKLKMEMLWFGANSGGLVEWLGNEESPYHLRTPDYVLYSPGWGSTKTTSNFTLKGTYTLDYEDASLRARETYVLGQVMGRIAQWDTASGSPHTVVGVQLNNEAMGFNDTVVIDYLSAVGSAVKQSSYVVWTRLNCVNGFQSGRIAANEALRESSSTNIDFIGVDLYRVGPSKVRSELQYSGLNYRSINENAANLTNSDVIRVSALAGNQAYSAYDALGPENYGLYVPVPDGSSGSFEPRYAATVSNYRVINRLLASDQQDIATLANGCGLFVHNWNGSALAPTLGVEGVVFTPATAASQAISITRSNTELVLMNTQGGAFTYPAALGVTGATVGYFDSSNEWVPQGNVAHTLDSISPPAGVTVRVTHANSGEPVILVRRQAEFGSLGGGATVHADMPGFAGNGYVGFPSDGGHVQLDAVDGLNGGKRTLRVRYALGAASEATAILTVNGAVSNITFAPSGAWDVYGLVSTSVTLAPGQTNSIRIASIGEGAGNVDEIQIY